MVKLSARLKPGYSANRRCCWTGAELKSQLTCKKKDNDVVGRDVIELSKVLKKVNRPSQQKDTESDFVKTLLVEHEWG